MSIEMKLMLSGDADNLQLIQARGFVAALSVIFGPKLFDDAPVPPPTAATVFAGVTPVTTPAPDDEDAGARAGDGLGVDADGLPWDERIHSSNKQKIADGTWRAKRNVSNALVQQVTAELKARGAAPVPTPTPAAPVPAPPVADPVPAPTPAPPAAAGGIGFIPFMQRITAKTSSGVTVDQLLAQLPMFMTMLPAGTANIAAMGDFSDGKPGAPHREIFLSLIGA